MALEVNGTSIETNEEGFLVNVNDWNEDIAKAMVEAEGLECTDKHMDVIKYLREEHVSKGEEPNERTILKAMKDVWGKKPTSKEMFKLFPGAPSKQGRKCAGLPKSNRKGGY